MVINMDIVNAKSTVGKIVRPRVVNFTDDNRRLIEQIAILSSENARLSEENSRLRHSCELSDEIIGKFSSETESLRIKNENLEKQVAELKAELAKSAKARKTKGKDERQKEEANEAEKQV